MTVRELQEILSRSEAEAPVLIWCGHSEAWRDLGKVRLGEVFDHCWEGYREVVPLKEDDRSRPAVLISLPQYRCSGWGGGFIFTF